MLTSRFDAVLFLFLHHRFFDFFKMFVGKVKVKITEERAAVKRNMFKVFGFVPFLFVMIMKMTMHNSAAGRYHL